LSDVSTAIRYFEAGLQHGVAVAAEADGQPAPRPSVRSIFSRRGPRKPPGFHYYLSVLYLELGDKQKALDHARAFRSRLGEEDAVAEWDARIRRIVDRVRP
jgi:hypothetical protein